MANSQKSALTGRAVPGHRYLAPNVVCMFAEDRPALPKQRKRGQYCGNVLPIWIKTRIFPGVVAEMCGDVLPCNLGKRVRVIEIVEPRLRSGEWWRIEALSGRIAVADPRHAGANAWATTYICLAGNLRRVLGVDHV